MKKRNLTAAFLACALCAATMTGTACSPHPSLTDEVEPIAMESATGERSLETEAEGKLDNEVNTAEAQVGETVQAEAEAIVETEAAAPPSPKGETISEGEAAPSSKPAANNASQQEAKKPSQSSATAPKQEVQPEPDVVALEADPIDDKISLVIDAIPATPEENTVKTITINGVEMSYVDAYGATTAPDTDAGIWKGSDSTTDGSYGYFIGHDSTDFGGVADMELGSEVAVTDGNGDSRTYQVVDSFVVPKGSYWSDISGRVTGYGESIVMQTCVDDGYQIVVAE